MAATMVSSPPPWCLLALTALIASVVVAENSICLSGSVPPLLTAPYAAGIIAVDGNRVDWQTVPGMRVRLRQVLEMQMEYPYGDGEATLKAAHDGRDVFFLLQVPAPYVYSQQEEKLNAAVALMFSVGENATFLGMGGCLQRPDTCSAVTCNGHAVDIMQFQPMTEAVPGRVYGDNWADRAEFSGNDRFGHLVDMYGYNTACKWLDGAVATPSFKPGDPQWGAGGSQNEWKGAWQHTSLGIAGQSPFTWGSGPFGVAGSPGEYVYEFARPLTTQDRLQQDVQLAVGRKQRFGAAFWYPVSNHSWAGGEHFLAHCDWMDLELLPGSGAGAAAVGATGATVLGSVSVVLSLGAVAAAAYAGCLFRRHQGFEGIARLS